MNQANKIRISPGNLKVKLFRDKQMQYLELRVNAWLAAHGPEIDQVIAVSTTVCDHVYATTIAYTPRLIIAT